MSTVNGVERPIVTSVDLLLLSSFKAKVLLILDTSVIVFANVLLIVLIFATAPDNVPLILATSMIVFPNVVLNDPT